MDWRCETGLRKEPVNARNEAAVETPRQAGAVIQCDFSQCWSWHHGSREYRVAGILARGFGLAGFGFGLTNFAKAAILKRSAYWE